MSEYRATLELIESDSDNHYLTEEAVMDITFDGFPEEGSSFLFQREDADKPTLTSLVQIIEETDDGCYTIITRNSTYELILEDYGYDEDSQFTVEFEFTPDDD